MTALEAWCEAQGLELELATKSFGDLSFKGEKGKSVLNLRLNKGISWYLLGTW